MRMKSRKSPAGMVEFAQALKESNTPNEYVQNPDVIKAMQKPAKFSTPKTRCGMGTDFSCFFLRFQTKRAQRRTFCVAESYQHH